MFHLLDINIQFEPFSTELSLACSMAMPAAKKCRKHHDQSNVMQYLVLTIVILIFKKDGIVNSIFLDPQKYNICVNKILWIHKNMKSIVSKFCGSTKKQHIQLQNFYGSTKFCHICSPNFVDPQNFVIYVHQILWIHKILAYSSSQFCGSKKKKKTRKSKFYGFTRC